MLYQILIYPIELIIEIIFYLANQILNNPGLSIIAVSFGVNFLTLFWVKVTLCKILLKFDYFFRILELAIVFCNLYNIDAFWVV